MQVENTYSKDGSLLLCKDKVSGKNYQFERDSLDNVTAVYEVDGNGLQVYGGYGEAYSYNAYGKLAGKTIAGAVSQEYIYTYSDNAKRSLKTLSTPLALEEYEYDCLGRNKKIAQTFGVNTFGKRFSYKKVGDHTTNLINGIAYLKNGTTDGKLSYTYDNMGNISSVRENGRQTAKYTYDALNRLIKENLLDKGKEICYTYDNNGNILTKSVNGAIVEYKYKEDSDQLVAFGDETFVYDVLGNPTTFRGMTATWQNGRQLKSLSDGTSTVEYTYNGKGLRKSKKVGGVTISYTYDSNDKLIKEVGEKTIEYVYGADGIIGIKINGTPYLFRKNVFSDITHIYNEQGDLVGKYSYTAFGECTVDLDIGGVASDNPIRYRSYYYDDETSLYYLKTRYYDPEIGRFMTIDGIEYLNSEVINGLNLYAYCGNNPVMRVDENGNAWWHWLVGIAVIAVLALATVATAGVAGVGIGTAFAAGFAGAAIGTGVSGALVTVAAGAFAGAVISAGVGLVSGALFGGISSTMNGGSFWNGALEGASTGFMMGAITGAISGGIRSGITYARTTPLLRSVSANELESIKSMKAFSSNGSMESKWFATNKANVAEWAKYFEQSDYVGIRIPKNVLSNQGVYFNSLLDGIGPAYCIDIDLLNTIIRGLWFF